MRRQEKSRVEDRQPRHRRPSVLLPSHVPTSAPSTRSCGPLVLRKPAIDAPTVPAYRAQSHGAPRSGPKGNVRMGGVGGGGPHLCQHLYPRASGLSCLRPLYHDASPDLGSPTLKPVGASPVHLSRHPPTVAPIDTFGPLLRSPPRSQSASP